MSVRALTSVTVIDVDDDAENCALGDITALDTYAHFLTTDVSCIHSHQPLPALTLLHREFVLALNWQPVIFARYEHPIVASRRGDVVALAVHHVGPPCRKGRQRPALRQRTTYDLHPIRFPHHTSHDPALLLGVASPEQGTR